MAQIITDARGLLKIISVLITIWCIWCGYTVWSDIHEDIRTSLRNSQANFESNCVEKAGKLRYESNFWNSLVYCDYASGGNLQFEYSYEVPFFATYEKVVNKITFGSLAPDVH